MRGKKENSPVPQYELMYILSSAVPDNEEPAITDAVAAFISEQGGEILKVEKLGKKKLAYPIKKTRNGFYVQIKFNAATDKISEIDHKIRMTGTIIRHLLLNIDDDLIRQAKDLEEQKLIKRSRTGEPSAAKKSAEAKPHI